MFAWPGKGSALLVGGIGDASAYAGGVWLVDLGLSTLSLGQIEKRNVQGVG